MFNQSDETPLEIISHNALEAMEHAAIDIQITTAKRYPRNEAKVKERILALATSDEQTAGECYYSFERGGTLIEGPGVRLAEIVAQAYGNLHKAVRVIEIQDHRVKTQAVAWDLENNVREGVEYVGRITIKGEDGVKLAANAALSLARRNAVFAVVPRTFYWPAYLAAKAKAVGDVKSLPLRRTEALRVFKQYGIDSERVLAAIGRKAIDEINLDDIQKLVGFYTAIRDGQASVDETFPPLKKDLPPDASTPKAPDRNETGVVPAPAGGSPLHDAGIGPLGPKRRGRPRKEEQQSKPSEQPSMAATPQTNGPSEQVDPPPPAEAPAEQSPFDPTPGPVQSGPDPGDMVRSNLANDIRARLAQVGSNEHRLIQKLIEFKIKEDGTPINLVPSLESLKEETLRLVILKNWNAIEKILKEENK